jgi:hypothetical protein
MMVTSIRSDASHWSLVWVLMNFGVDLVAVAAVLVESFGMPLFVASWACESFDMVVELEPAVPEVEGLVGLEVDGLDGCADGSDFCAGWLGLG